MPPHAAAALQNCVLLTKRLTNKENGLRPGWTHPNDGIRWCRATDDCEIAPVAAEQLQPHSIGHGLKKSLTLSDTGDG